VSGVVAGCNAPPFPFGVGLKTDNGIEKPVHLVIKAARVAALCSPAAVVRVKADLKHEFLFSRDANGAGSLEAVLGEPAPPNLISCLSSPSDPRVTRSDRQRCGAKTRKGTPCQAPAVWDKQRDKPINGRCKLHGWLSTGAKTEEGQRRSAQAASEGMKRYWENRRRREEVSSVGEPTGAAVGNDPAMATLGTFNGAETRATPERASHMQQITWSSQSV
jgi:hypothetical protein